MVKNICKIMNLPYLLFWFRNHCYCLEFPYSVQIPHPRCVDKDAAPNVKRGEVDQYIESDRNVCILFIFWLFCATCSSLREVEALPKFSQLLSFVIGGITILHLLGAFPSKYDLTQKIKWSTHFCEDHTSLKLTPGDLSGRWVGYRS